MAHHVPKLGRGTLPPLYQILWSARMGSLDLSAKHLSVEVPLLPLKQRDHSQYPGRVVAILMQIPE